MWEGLRKDFGRWKSEKDVGGQKFQKYASTKNKYCLNQLKISEMVKFEK